MKNLSEGGFIPRVHDEDRIPCFLEAGVTYVSRETFDKYGIELLKQLNGKNTDIVVLNNEEDKCPK